VPVRLQFSLYVIPRGRVVEKGPSGCIVSLCLAESGEGGKVVARSIVESVVCRGGGQTSGDYS